MSGVSFEKNNDLFYKVVNIARPGLGLRLFAIIYFLIFFYFKFSMGIY